MRDDSSPKAVAAAAGRRTRRRTPAGVKSFGTRRCVGYLCERQVALINPVALCRYHALAVQRRVLDELDQINFCFWPGCGHEDTVLDSRLCKFHLADAAAKADSDYETHEQLKQRRDEMQTRKRAFGLDQKPTATTGTVYALLSGYNVKVGYTSRPLAERLREYPPSTTVLVYFPGKRGDETRIKRKFAHLRTHGNEWLPYAPQVTEWVEQMQAEHGTPDPTMTCGPAKYEVPRPHAQKPVAKPRGTVWHVS